MITDANIHGLVRRYVSGEDTGLGPIGRWNVSKVTNMSGLFSGQSNFNERLYWDTSNVTDMRDMFYNCVLMNQPIYFDTSKVTNMQSMFSLCISLNKPVVFTSTRNVVCMSNMFSRCTSFNQYVDFDMRNVTSMIVMFAECNTFNNGGKPLVMNTYKAKNMMCAFSGCSALSVIVTIDASSAMDMCELFMDCINLVEPDLINVQENTEMTNIFQGTPYYAFTGMENICIGG